MTETDDELIALCDAATSGPWEAWDSLYVNMKAAIVAPGLDPLVTVAEVRTNYDDAKFLAAASPERVKALVMRVRELEDANAIANEMARQRKVEHDEMSARLERAEEALRIIKDRAWYSVDPYDDMAPIHDVAAAYFDNPAGEGE